MHQTEIAKRKRHCGTCNSDIKKGEAHIAYGSIGQYASSRNLCLVCAHQLLLEAIALNKAHKGGN